MIDIKLIRENPEIVKHNLKIRQKDEKVVDEILEIDKEWRKIKGKLDELRSKRNKIGLKIAEAKKSKLNADEFLKESKLISDEIDNLLKEEHALIKKRDSLLATIPNILDKSVPIGKDDTENVEIRKWGKIPEIEKPLEHYEIGEKLGLMDLVRGAKLGGHRFTVLWGKLARLERAIIQFFLDENTEAGYKELWLPHLVKTNIMFGSGQLPKFEEDLYKTSDDLWLIPTAEVPLVNLHNNEILDKDIFPLKYTAHTPSYRREAGSYGKDIKGFLRQHQFDKVELVQFTLPEKSFDALEEITNQAEHLLKKLEIPYRVVVLCSGDIGFCSTKTYDIEVWLPGQNKYREISSISNCLDFQSRRANIRYRDGNELKFPHTLNGSGLAVGRTLIAIMENYQDDDGFKIPKALIPYTGFDRVDYPK